MTITDPRPSPLPPPPTAHHHYPSRIQPCWVMEETPPPAPTLAGEADEAGGTLVDSLEPDELSMGGTGEEPTQGRPSPSRRGRERRTAVRSWGAAYYDYEAKHDDELSFERGSIIQILDKNW